MSSACLYYTDPVPLMRRPLKAISATMAAMKISTLLVIVGLLGALAGVVLWDWSVFAGIGFDLPPIGWIALGLGALVTIAIGSGLMFLVFYSSRHGYDDAVGSKDEDGTV
jgi:hypothetical protein